MIYIICRFPKVTIGAFPKNESDPYDRARKIREVSTLIVPPHDEQGHYWSLCGLTFAILHPHTERAQGEHQQAEGRGVQTKLSP